MNGVNPITIWSGTADGCPRLAHPKQLAELDSEAGAILDASPRGVSLVTGPGGTTLAEQPSDQEGILHAEIDLDECVEPKQFHDVSGGYNRFDVFQLTVNRTANRPIRFEESSADAVQ